MENGYQGDRLDVLTRRLSRRHLILAGIGTAGAALLQACGGQEPIPQNTPTSSGDSGSQGGAGSTPEGTEDTESGSGTTEEVTHQRGGIIKVAMIGEPPSVADAMFTTTTVTSDITRHIFEGLFAQDSEFNPRPMLVDRYEISDDGLLYTFTLRSGIKFHDGSELTAEDVVASLERWGVMTGRGKIVYSRLAEEGVQATDPLTVTMTFAQPTGILLDFLALHEAFIMPAAIAREVGTEKLPDEKTIGTGPFLLKEHQVDRLIRLVRFEDYQPRTEDPDGHSGRKEVYIDELHIIPVPDVTVATNGLITGEFHFARDVDPDQFELLQSDPNVVPIIDKPGMWICVNFNKKQGPMTDKRLRQVVAMAFDRQQALIAAFGNIELTRLDPGIAMQETAWHTDVGDEVYRNVDPEAAKALLAETDYNGEPLRWLTTKEYPYHYNTAAYIKQELEKIGVNVELVVSDWATVVQRRAQPDLWELLVVGLPGSWHPATQIFNDKEWPGWWDDPRKDEILSRMVELADPEERYQTIVEYQQLIYEELPFIKIGDSHTLQARRAEIQGYVTGNAWFFWNVSLSQGS